MASSFLCQIETIVLVLQKLSPATILDIGKGFGKYGFLVHEYVGIDSRKRPDPTRTLAQQSRVAIDAIESNPDYMWPHIAEIYRSVTLGRIEEVYRNIGSYDTVLMLDVIEHLSKSDGIAIVRHFISMGSTVVISTPARFFQQSLYESPDEAHKSVWSPSDFAQAAEFMVHQRIGPGRVFILSNKVIPLVPGFGSHLLARLRRIYRTIRDDTLAR
jgi:hypothetical protein